MEKFNVILIQSDDGSKINELFLIKKSTTLIGSDEICDIVLNLDHHIEPIHVKINAENSNDLGIEDVSLNGAIIKEKDGSKISLKKGKEYEFLSGRSFYLDDKSKLKISLLVVSLDQLNRNFIMNKISCLEHYLNSFVYEHTIIKEIENTDVKINENLDKISESLYVGKIHAVSTTRGEYRDMNESNEIDNNIMGDDLGLKETGIKRNNYGTNYVDNGEEQYINEIERDKNNIEIQNNYESNKILEKKVVKEGIYIEKQHLKQINEKYDDMIGNNLLEKIKYDSNEILVKNENKAIENYDKDRDKILREVLPNLSEENNKNIEEILQLKNSEINNVNRCEDFIIPIEVDDCIKEYKSGEASPKEKSLNKMLEAAIPKKETMEKYISDMIPSKVKETGIINQNQETPVNFSDCDLKKKKNLNKEIIDESILISNKRKRNLVDTEDREITENQSKNLNQLSLPLEKISTPTIESQNEIKFNQNNLSLLQKDETSLTPNILKISIDDDASINKKLIKKIKFIKCEIVDEQESEYDLLICNKLSKKFKILLAINNRIPILSSKWLEDSIINKTKMPYDKYYTNDKEFAKKFNFDLFKIMNETPYAIYMEEFSFYVSDHVANKDEIEELIESAGGRVCDNYRNFKKKREKLIIIADKNNDREFIKSLKAKGGYNIHNVDLIMNSVISQELQIEKARYKI